MQYKNSWTQTQRVKVAAKLKIIILEKTWSNLVRSKNTHNETLAEENICPLICLNSLYIYINMYILLQHKYQFKSHQKKLKNRERLLEIQI